jgi:flavin reductase (DIM6/NTAB) family NADH-FMN oxidoreductase RutF
MVCFVSVGRKDTLNNVEATRAFVYNIGGRALVERINRSAANFPPEISEFDWAGLTPIPGERIAVPRVAEAAVQMEAEVNDIIRIGQTDNHLVIGEIVAFHIAERILHGDRVDTTLLDPVGRLAGADYAAMGDIFRLERPTWQLLQETESEPMPRLGDR